MADQSQETGRTGSELHELRHVNWREVFGFTHVFKSFRLSRHMTKMVIAVLAVVLTWGLGQVLDLAFFKFSDIYNLPVDRPQRRANDQQQVVRITSEADAYWREGDIQAWRTQAKNKVGEVIAMLATSCLAKDGPAGWKEAPYKDAKEAKEKAESSPGDVLSRMRDFHEWQLKEAVGKAGKDSKAVDDDKNKDQKEKDKAEEARDNAVRAANAEYIAGQRALGLLDKQGPFATFVDYEGYYFSQAVQAVIHGNIATGFETIHRCKLAAQDRAGEPEYQDRLRAGELPGGQIEDPLGLLASLSLMGYGILWLASAHWLFAIIFFILLLLIWSVAGGAIARAAALQATRDEKAGLGECLRFGVRKMFSFLASPLVPILVFLLVGLVASAVSSLVGMIPGFGPIWIGLTFGVILLVGVLLAFLLIGLLAGGLLMTPTVAVEGSDTFDACTRSYQFVLARPWRAALYGAVAAVYGAICYFFVRFLLFMVLLVGHWVVSILYFRSGSAVREGAKRWDLMWPGPTFGDFFPGSLLPGGLRDVDNNVMWSGWDWFGSGLVGLWVMLISAVLVAWVISYLFSASTMIYLLLRKAEDATDMKEVYVEEPAEELAAAPTTTPAGEAAPASAAGGSAEAGPAPSSPPPAPQSGGDPPKA